MPSSSPNSGYEKKDVNAGLIFLYVFIPAVVIVLLLVGLDQFYISTQEKIYYESVLAPISPQLKEVQAKEQGKLTGYELIDEETRTFRIPIDRAMQLLINEGRSGKGRIR